MKFSTFAIFAAATVAVAAAGEVEVAESDHLMDFWSKFDGWKWNCSAYGAKAKEASEMESEIEKAGEEPEWLMTEWVNKMMEVKHKKHNLSDWETGKLAKMWSICDWFKTKKNHTKVYGEEEMDIAEAEKADEEFLMDFFKGCSAWKHNKTWTWGWAKKNFTWFSKSHKEGEGMNANIED